MLFVIHLLVGHRQIVSNWEAGRVWIVEGVCQEEDEKGHRHDKVLVAGGYPLQT